MRYAFTAEHRPLFSVRAKETARQTELIQTAWKDVFGYIEKLCNAKRKHARNGMLSPAEFERQQKMRTEGV